MELSVAPSAFISPIKLTFSKIKIIIIEIILITPMKLIMKIMIKLFLSNNLIHSNTEKKLSEVVIIS